MESDFLEEQNYIKAKKRVKEIKGFYIHLFIYIFSCIIVITINLLTSPWFQWFWFTVLGWGIGIFFHWMAVFGFRKIGFSKEWEERKIKELMDEQNYKDNNYGK